MERKLIKQGAGGFTIYLPKKWVDQRQLKAGDNIRLEESDEALLLTTKAKIKKETSINLEENDKHYIYVKLSHLYRMGFDRITVQFKDKKTIKIISDVVSKNLLGFEITEKRDNVCILENITEPTAEKFSVLLRRVFLQVKETHAAVLDDFKNNKKENKEEIEHLRHSLDKHIFFLRRTIMKKRNIEENAILHWELLTFLMHIQHGYYYMYKGYNKSCKSMPKNIVITAKKLGPYFEKYYNAYYTKNQRLLDEIQKDKIILEKEINHIIETKKKNDGTAQVLTYLHLVVRVVQIGGSPLQALLFDENTGPRS